MAMNLISREVSNGILIPLRRVLAVLPIHEVHEYRVWGMELIGNNWEGWREEWKLAQSQPEAKLSWSPAALEALAGTDIQIVEAEIVALITDSPTAIILFELSVVDSSYYLLTSASEEVTCSALTSGLFSVDHYRKLTEE